MDHQTLSKTKNKVKLLCCYGGQILLKPHANNNIAYSGGVTKIIAVDRNINLSALKSILYSFCKTNVNITYQFPGEDLDTLISVINDEDLEHMMCEYDHSSRSSSWLRLLLFPNPDPAKTTDSPSTSAPATASTTRDSALAPLIRLEDDEVDNSNTEGIQQKRKNRIEDDIAALAADYHLSSIPETPKLLPLHDQAQAQAQAVASGGYFVVPVTDFPAVKRIEQGGCSSRAAAAAPILSGMSRGMMMSNGQNYYVVPIQPAQVYHHSSALLRF